MKITRITQFHKGERAVHVQRQDGLLVIFLDKGVIKEVTTSQSATHIASLAKLHLTLDDAEVTDIIKELKKP